MTPEDRTRAVLYAEAITHGLTGDDADRYVAALEDTLHGRWMTLGYALEDLRREVSTAVRRLLRR